MTPKVKIFLQFTFKYFDLFEFFSGLSGYGSPPPPIMHQPAVGMCGLIEIEKINVRFDDINFMVTETHFKI